METDQIDKRVTWLDEQRRKDSETIARIHERLDGFEGSLRKQNTQLEGLASDLARISALAARVREFDDSLGKHRMEVNKQLETLESRRMTREEQLDSIRRTEQKQISDSMEGMRGKLKELDSLREALEVRRQEELRLNRALDATSSEVKKLADGIEERGRHIASLQEARKQDGKRISEVESRSTELVRGVEGLRGQLDSVQDQLRKLTAKVGELDRSETELRHAQTVWSEQQSVRLAEFERLWKGWEKQFEGVEESAKALDRRMEGYQETFRELANLRDKLDSTIEGLDRRITEVAEIQRLNADRFKGEWAGFQAEDQKRWTGFKLSQEELWKDHERAHQKLNSALEVVQADLEDAIAGLANLARGTKERLREAMALVQEWGADLTQDDQSG